MGAKKAVVGLLLAAVAGGCAPGGDDAALATLALRLEQVERRAAAHDRNAAPEDRLGAIEARLAALEARSAAAAEHDAPTPTAKANAPADSGSAAPASPPRAHTLRERNQRAKKLAEEDRARLAGIREQFSDRADPVARRQAMSEVRARRRAEVQALRQRDSASGEKK